MIVIRQLSRSFIFFFAFALNSYLVVNADDPWVAQRSISAEEAFQAAAADSEFFYAVASNKIAKYRRLDGVRVGISTGEAKHLNSGFIWQRKLLSAHSNYPHTPEISEVKVLDPQTMSLSTFKHFGSYGGSLTWVVRHRNSWWCNFAVYGSRNAETFLAKFDDDWNEVGRWTYPPEVISRLGNYSLSGGVWFEDELLVTGHDDPVVFQLALPSTGQVLKFVGQQLVPFTGQGIAVDPVTHGLVGISRAKRMLILAARKMAE